MGRYGKSGRLNLSARRYKKGGNLPNRKMRLLTILIVSEKHSTAIGYHLTKSLDCELVEHTVRCCRIFPENIVLQYALQEVVAGRLDGDPPHWHNNVREYLNDRLSHRWIGRALANDLPLFCWPTSSSDLTPCDFFLWDFLKDKVFVLPLPQDFQELKQRTTNVLNALTGCG
ncbi:hypothetical protein AVEN_235936-1 [Araneus ventricosus]|uniref:Uncharacterized protein n=1 Tax=Araneus ventricosus TaxID=182803 RepID=A0A4Y2MZ12_ARAVE|nr:hypothetical protein AVEN_235936-1 [Araneus ventricosus]